ncbi:MAG: hypothetical protein AB7O46_03135 [Xanthobacteraceae bacterium]
MMHEIRDFFSRVGHFFARSDLDRVDAHDMEVIARDIGVAAADLYRLESDGAFNPSLLPQRMSQEGIDASVVQAEWPPVWKDLQRVCAFCESKHICKYDLEHAPDASGWHRYCGNEGTLKTLHTNA